MKTQMPKGIKRSGKTRAFSLLELAVVMVIASIMFGGGTVMIAATIKSQALENTQKRMYQAMKDLLNFSTAYGYLPCPANLNAVYGSPNYGVGTGTGANGFGPTTCTDASYSHVTADGVRVVMGLYPVSTLGKPNEDSLDGMGNRILYAVTETMTQKDALTNHPGETPQAASIVVYNDVGQPKPKRATYALTSMGPNERGARSRDNGSIIKKDEMSAYESMNAVLTPQYDVFNYLGEVNQSKLLDTDDIVLTAGRNAFQGYKSGS